MERAQHVAIVFTLGGHELVPAEDGLGIGAQRQVSFAPTMLADDGQHEKWWLDLGPDDPGVLDAIADFNSS
ncbi:MAG: hypothetical protein BWY85_02050 [Firmicutes bacterium ADurb.Bin506]|nr:MAG: hypothetical protein BWY85_02050 [Firmicutes bacterium ADurb.Bin506]